VAGGEGDKGEVRRLAGGEKEEEGEGRSRRK